LSLFSASASLDVALGNFGSQRDRQGMSGKKAFIINELREVTESTSWYIVCSIERLPHDL